MNLLDYNMVMEALGKEQQLLLNREQYGAEHILVHHAMQVIAELPIIRQPEIVRCRDCKYWSEEFDRNCLKCSGRFWFQTTPDWFCADGQRR